MIELEITGAGRRNPPRSTHSEASSHCLILILPVSSVLVMAADMHELAREHANARSLYHAPTTASDAAHRAACAIRNALATILANSRHDDDDDDDDDDALLTRHSCVHGSCSRG